MCLFLREDFVPGTRVANEPGGFCAFIIAGFVCFMAGSILCLFLRDDFVRLLLLEDFVCFMAGKILCREANVRHPSKAANIRKSYNQEPHILRR